jgi:hypothetical protein
MSDVRVEADELQVALLEVLAFLAASAHGAVASTRLYGPLRLMEGCERLIRVMESLGIADQELSSMANSVVDNGMLLSTDTERCRQLTDDATLRLARKLEQASRHVRERQQSAFEERPLQC